jgi:hypothetical protein
MSFKAQKTHFGLIHLSCPEKKKKKTKKTTEAKK